jgi:uncharacterized protein
LIYLDTSVVVAYYCPEPISKRAESIIRGKEPVFVSDLTEVEVISALSRKIRTGELSKTDGAAIRNYFVSHLEQGIFRRTSLGPHHIRAARELLSSFTTPLRTLDALHLAIAGSEEFQVVTADQAFARAAKALSIRAMYIKSRS